MACVALPFACLLAAAANEVPLRQIYEARDWFALRDALCSATHPLFYRAAVSLAFNDLEQARKHLEDVIRSAHDSREEYDAREMLVFLHWRRGDFRTARLQLERMLAMKPEAEDVRKFLALFTALSEFPQQQLERRRFSRIPCSSPDALRGPGTINGIQSSLLFDTGANISAISESQAAKLRMRTRRGAGGTLGDGHGPYSLTVGDIALADRVAIGDMTFRNVAFLVQSDERFTDTPEPERVIIGLPVLLAMRTIRWTRGVSLEFGFPSGPKNGQQPDLCFDSAFPVVALPTGKDKLSFSFDTGACCTDLYARFQREFPEVVAAGRKDTGIRTGAGGTVRDDVVVLRDIPLQLGGLSTVLRSAKLFPSENSVWHGNLGMDLLKQARVVTIDFGTMQLKLSH
jgi:hypothetical protein